MLRKYMRKAKTIQRSRRPFEKGKELLSEGYREFLGTEDFMDALRFEMLRSAVVQRLHDLSEGDDWICAAKLDEEVAAAKRQRRRFYSSAGISAFVKEHSINREMTGRLISLGRKVNTYTRFLGSVRHYVPGVGYAVSIKKRHGPNQDSFLLQKGLMAVADGTGSEKFSAMASHMAILRLAERRQELQDNPKATIVSINRELTDLMSAGAKLCIMEEEILGSTTLTLGLIEGARKRIYSLGNSLAFLKHDSCERPVVEQIGMDKHPYWVLGHTYGLDESHIDSHERRGEPLILTTDGITRRIRRTNRSLERFFICVRNNVAVAERLVRLAIRNSLRTGMTDDMTVVIQE